AVDVLGGDGGAVHRDEAGGVVAVEPRDVHRLAVLGGGADLRVAALRVPHHDPARADLGAPDHGARPVQARRLLHGAGHEGPLLAADRDPAVRLAVAQRGLDRVLPGALQRQPLTGRVPLEPDLGPAVAEVADGLAVTYGDRDQAAVALHPARVVRLLRHAGRPTLERR